jgi:hypothetical protein
MTFLFLGAASSDAQMLTAEEFLILPYVHRKMNLKELEEIRDSGHNLAGMVSVEDLDLLQEAGLKGIVFDPTVHAGDAEAELSDEEIERRVTAVVRRVNGHPAAFGYFLRDEPNARIFPGLARWTAAYRKVDPKARPVINLFPNYASPGALGSDTYRNHVEDFVRLVKPPLLSYDHYALMDDGSLRDGYFQNLEVIREVALANNIPFCNVVLSNAHFHYADPSDGGLRFQVYTTLAYGARGICYFTYWAPPVGNYRLAPIDQFGNKTPTWDMLRNVNLQIHKLGPTYIKLKSVNVFHHPNVPAECRAISTAKHVADAGGGDLLVGEFDGSAGEAVALVVNKDLHHSCPFWVSFQRAGTVMMVNSYTGAHEPFGGENGWLAAGQGMLLYVK